jgi:hypothetical protein
VLIKKTVPNNDVEIVVAIKINHNDFYTWSIRARRCGKKQFLSSAQPEIQKAAAKLDQVWFVVSVKVGICPAMRNAGSHRLPV